MSTDHSQRLVQLVSLSAIYAPQMRDGIENLTTHKLKFDANWGWGKLIPN